MPARVPRPIKALLAACAVLVLFAGTARADFYRYPSARTLASGPVGGLLAYQPLRFDVRPRPARALRIMYRSQDETGRPIAVTGFVMVPRGRPPRGGWPIIAWAHGTSGIGWRCAPSRSPILYPRELGFLSYEVAAEYGVLVARLVSEGFVVVGTDYEGLGFPGRFNTYAQLDSEARAVIDSVRAARQLVPHTSARWFAVGHSQGGQAALGAGQLALRRRPDLQFMGTVSIAPGSHYGFAPVIPSSFHPPYQEPGTGDLMTYFSYLMVSVKLFAPSFNYTDVMAPEVARAMIPYAKQWCLGKTSHHFAKLRPQPPHLINPNWAKSKSFLRFASANEPALYTSSGPIMLIQGDKDVSVPHFVTDLLNGELCGLGNTVDYRKYPGADHDNVIPRAYPDILRWLRDRLAGRRAPQTCTS